MAFMNGKKVMSAFVSRYNAGYQDGHHSGYDEGYNDGVTTGHEGGYAEGYEIGKQAEYDGFWNKYQKNGKEKSYVYAFGGESWDDELYNPKYPIKASNAIGMFIYAKNITDTKVLIDITGAGPNSTQMFADASKLVTVRCLKVAENSKLINSFTNCTSLENISFDGVIGRDIDMQWCPLTESSMRSVIEHLSLTETGRTVTFKKTAKENAFTDDEWNELISGKTNWTFSLI